MTKVSDIQSLFAEIGISGDGYKNLDHAQSQRESLGRWPLLSEVHEEQEAALGQNRKSVAADSALPRALSAAAGSSVQASRPEAPVSIRPPVQASVQSTPTTRIEPVFADMLRSAAPLAAAPVPELPAANKTESVPAAPPLAQFIAPRVRGVATPPASAAVPVAPVSPSGSGTQALAWPAGRAENKMAPAPSASSEVKAQTRLKDLFGRLAQGDRQQGAVKAPASAASGSLIERLNKL